VLGQQGRRATELRAGAEALADPQQRKENRRGHADLRVGGEESDHSGRQAHEERRDDQRGAPADPVTEPAEEKATEWPEQEADPERGERDQDAGRGIPGGKEDLVEHQGGGSAVDEEVVPLERRADDRAEDDPAKFCPAIVVVILVCLVDLEVRHLTAPVRGISESGLPCFTSLAPVRQPGAQLSAILGR
jgi:hypothetical protein